MEFGCMAQMATTDSDGSRRLKVGRVNLVREFGDAELGVKRSQVHSYRSSRRLEMPEVTGPQDVLLTEPLTSKPFPNGLLA